ncbi:MAG: co-chaperone GroES [Alphaproteobacteria bacterium]|nr:co-chaperone GroES [Alphaproteobacteria bacterium]
MKLKPIHNNIIIKRLPEEAKTAGGIIIPDSAKEKPSRGQVVAAGEGAFDERGSRIPMTVKAGDVVLFAKWGGTDTKIDGEELVIIKETDVLAILEK